MTSPPRPIEGSVGSRVRLIFGDNGSEWLLLLNEDDGNRKWQSHYWSNIPNAVAKQLNNCSSKGRYAKEIDFGPDGEWFVHGIKWDGTGGHSWWGNTHASTKIKTWSSKKDRLQVYFGSDDSYSNNETHAMISGDNGHWLSDNLNENLASRIDKIYKQSKAINFVRLFHDDQYFISDDLGTEWVVMGTPCSKELKKNCGTIEEVALAKDGSWVVICPNSFELSYGVDSELNQHLSRFFRVQKERNEKRSAEISEHHARIRREREEREAREIAEREAEETRQRQEEADRRLAEQIAKQAAEQEQKEADERRQKEKAGKLASLMEERIMEEAKDIKDLDDYVQKRKRSLHLALDAMPAERRAKIEKDISIGQDTARVAECVVCHSSAPTRAVVPCGHYCLCDECACTLKSSNHAARLCPLCRGKLESTLKIFSPK